jgi:hypothetical protein
MLVAGVPRGAAEGQLSRLSRARAETFLAPVSWEGGWPVVGEITDGPAWTEPVREDFDSPQLHPRWISVRSRPPLSLAGTASFDWFDYEALPG